MVAMNNDIVIGIRVELMKAKDQLKQAERHMRGLARTSKQSMDKVAKSQQQVYSVNQRLVAELNKGKIEFAGWAMSIMFFGMALKNTFSTIWRSSTKTFNDVMHSVEGSVTQFDMLNGSLDYLKFNAGQALEPIAAWLIPIVDWVSNWILENEELFRSIVVAGVAFGTFFTILGSGVLALNGFKEAAILARGALGISKFINPWTLLAAVIAGITFKAFNDAPGSFDAMVSSIKDDLSPTFTRLGETISQTFGILTGLEGTWENFGWTLSWLGAIAGAVFAGMYDALDAISHVISGLLISVSGLANALWKVVTLDFAGAKAAVKEAIKLSEWEMEGASTAFKMAGIPLQEVGTLDQYIARNKPQDTQTQQTNIFIDGIKVEGQEANALQESIDTIIMPGIRRFM